jgi:hypothetical protein
MMDHFALKLTNRASTNQYKLLYYLQINTLHTFQRIKVTSPIKKPTIITLLCVIYFFPPPQKSDRL